MQQVLSINVTTGTVSRVEKGLLLLFEAIPIYTTDIYLGTLPNLALSKNIQTL